MKMLAPASQGWLWALNKAAVLWLVLVTAIFNINIILMGRFHIFQECKSKLELTRIWTLGFSSFFFCPSQQTVRSSRKEQCSQSRCPICGSRPRVGVMLADAISSPTPLPHVGATAPVRGAADCPFSRWDRPKLESPEVAREAPQDVLLLGDLRSQQGPIARAGREWWTGVETQGTWPQMGFCGVLGRGWWCSNYELSWKEGLCRIWLLRSRLRVSCPVLPFNSFYIELRPVLESASLWDLWQILCCYTCWASVSSSVQWVWYCLPHKPLGRFSEMCLIKCSVRRNTKHKCEGSLPLWPLLIIISLTVKWDILSLGEIHEQGALEEGTSTVEACVRGLWGRAGWGPPISKIPGVYGRRQQSSKPEGDLVRVVAEGVEVLLSFQEGLWWFSPEAVSEVRVMGLSCCFSHINNICSNTYAHQKINSEIKPNPNKHKRNSTIIKQSLGT